MGKYLKLFETHQQYESYTADTSNFILPNVSYCEDVANEVHYNPYVEPPETRVVAKFNVTDTSSPTKIGSSKYLTGFSAIEIDGVSQPSVISAYTFSTTGEHTVKYTLTDPTTIISYSLSSLVSLTSVTIPNNVTTLEDGVFNACTGLTSVTIPDSVTIIRDGVFQSCGNLLRLNSDIDGVFNIPSGVTNIGTQVFMWCSYLTSVTIPNSVTSISYNVFQNCKSLTSITCNATTAPTIKNSTYRGIKEGGTLYVPSGSNGYNVWMGTGKYYLGYYNWTKVEQ